MMKHLPRIPTGRRLARRTRHGVGRALQRGQSSFEYIIITSMSVLVLIEGKDSSAVQSVVNAIKGAYRGFSYATSFSTGINIF